MPPKLVDTIDLCKELVILAAFLDNKKSQGKIYKAVRQLQLLEAEAVKAGIVRADR